MVLPNQQTVDARALYVGPPQARAPSSCVCVVCVVCVCDAVVGQVSAVTALSITGQERLGANVSTMRHARPCSRSCERQREPNRGSVYAWWCAMRCPDADGACRRHHQCCATRLDAGCCPACPLTPLAPPTPSALDTGSGRAPQRDGSPSHCILRQRLTRCPNHSTAPLLLSSPRVLIPDGGPTSQGALVVLGARSDACHCPRAPLGVSAVPCSSSRQTLPSSEHVSEQPRARISCSPMHSGSFEVLGMCTGG